jgi:ubiquinol-cytochrome c reductase cytochrome b subunit
MGVVAIGLTFLSLVALPFLSSVHVGSPKFRVISERLFWVFVADVFLLTWLGAQEIAPATVTMGILCTLVLFAYLLVVYPLLSWGESNLYLTYARLGRKALSAGDAK